MLLLAFLWTFSTCQFIFTLRRMSKRITELERKVNSESTDVEK